MRSPLPFPLPLLGFRDFVLFWGKLARRSLLALCGLSHFIGCLQQATSIVAVSEGS